MIALPLALALAASAAEVPSPKKPFIASSSLPASKVAKYGPENLVDLDLTTAWVEGAAGIGVGEWAGVYLGDAEEMAGVHRAFVYPYNGYRKPGSYLKNNVPRGLRIQLLVGETVVAETTQLSGRYYYFSNLDLTKAKGPFWLKATIEEAWAGMKWDDTAISELHVQLEFREFRGAAAASRRFCEAFVAKDAKVLEEFTVLTASNLYQVFGQPRGVLAKEPRCGQFAVAASNHFDLNWEGFSCRFTLKKGAWKFNRCAELPSAPPQ